MSKPQYRPDCPTPLLIVQLKIGGGVKKEYQPGTEWVCDATGEIFTLAEFTREGYLVFKEMPGRRFLRDRYTPVMARR